MAISKDRLEKEVVAQKYRAAKKEAEALAQKKKAEAIAHLESQGQRVKGVEGFSKKLAAKTADNTLALLLGRKAITTATEAEKIKEQLVKAALIRQQDEIRRSRESKLDKDDLPPNWESVLDNKSELFYYWNRITNVTTWEKPKLSENDDLVKILPTESEVSTSASVLEELPKTSSLLPGWEERNHTATLQGYYVNTISGEVRSVKPTLENCKVQSSEGKILETRTSENKKRPSTSSSSGDLSKFQRHSIDPLDFEALQGHARGGKMTDKMADSTASGPLWQQRPYPAPGTIMRSKEASSGNTVGPSYHSGHPPSSGSRAGPTNHKTPFVKGFAPNKGHSTARSAPGHYGPSR